MENATFEESLIFFKRNFKLLEDYEKELGEVLEKCMRKNLPEQKAVLVFREKEVGLAQLLSILYSLCFLKKKLTFCKKIIKTPKPWHDQEIKEGIFILLRIMDNLKIQPT